MRWGGGDIDGSSEHWIWVLICQPLNIIRTMISIVCQQGLMYTSLFHSPTTSMLATARFSTKIKTGFQHFLHGHGQGLGVNSNPSWNSAHYWLFWNVLKRSVLGRSCLMRSVPDFPVFASLFFAPGAETFLFCFFAKVSCNFLSALLLVYCLHIFFVCSRECKQALAF